MPKHDYLAFDHPLQRPFAARCRDSPQRRRNGWSSGVDGCSAPNYALPLSGLALAFARLATAEVDAEYGRAPKTLADAMTAHPEMVSGERRNDLALMQAGRGDWVTKIGAEGVQAIGVRSRGWGIAIKVADGNPRGLHPATVAVLGPTGFARRGRGRARWRRGAGRSSGIIGASSPATSAACVVLDKIGG